MNDRLESKKAQLVFNFYRDFYKSGAKFIGCEFFRRRLITPSKLLKEWGKPTIEFLYYEIIKYHKEYVERYLIFFQEKNLIKKNVLI